MKRGMQEKNKKRAKDENEREECKRGNKEGDRIKEHKIK